MSLTNKTIVINGTRVGYVDEGAGEVPVIFIHGFPFSKAMWHRQVEDLSNDYRVIAYDVRGHGDSEAGASEFTIAGFADDLIQFMDALHVSQAVVCGLSMGGYIALHAVEKYPARMAALILTDTQCAADTEEAKEKRKKTISFIRENGLSIYAGESVKNLFAVASFTTKPEEVSFIKNTILNTDAETICRTLMALAGRSEKCSILPAIQVPALIVVGREDKITPLSAAQRMNEGIAHSKIEIIEEAGHMSNLENPSAFNSCVREFLKTL